MSLSSWRLAGVASPSPSSPSYYELPQPPQSIATSPPPTGSGGIGWTGGFVRKFASVSHPTSTGGALDTWHCCYSQFQGKVQIGVGNDPDPDSRRWRPNGDKTIGSVATVIGTWDKSTSSWDSRRGYGNYPSTRNTYRLSSSSRSMCQDFVGTMSRLRSTRQDLMGNWTCRGRPMEEKRLRTSWALCQGRILSGDRIGRTQYRALNKGRITATLSSSGYGSNANPRARYEPCARSRWEIDTMVDGRGERRTLLSNKLGFAVKRDRSLILRHDDDSYARCMAVAALGAGQANAIVIAAGDLSSTTDGAIATLPAVGEAGTEEEEEEDWPDEEGTDMPPLVRTTVSVLGRDFVIVQPKDVDDVIDMYIRQGRLHRDPYWCRVWPSAIALAEEILSQPELVAGRRVCEFGAGLGLVGIAAAMAGAEEVVLFDREPLALRCAELAARANLGTPRVPFTLARSSRGIAVSDPSLSSSSSVTYSPLIDAIDGELIDPISRRERRGLEEGAGTVHHVEIQPRGIVRVKTLDWADVDVSEANNFDVVIGCDVLYEKPSVPMIAALIPRLLTRGRARHRRHRRRWRPRHDSRAIALISDPTERCPENRRQFIKLMQDRKLTHAHNDDHHGVDGGKEEEEEDDAMDDDAQGTTMVLRSQVRKMARLDGLEYPVEIMQFGWPSSRRQRNYR